ncbi:MAG TPA: hypothetical protein PLD99_02390 [Parcubacteria group bacterium]|nr:hypothetical protein [Parcubacteria group bacterium]
MLNNFFISIDQTIISLVRKVSIPVSRIAIFIVYFWFGLLKVLGLSPASPLVLSLLDRTMPFISPDAFLVWFGLFEVLIGTIFLIPKFARAAIALLVIHLITTVMPLFLLKSSLWTGMMVPTLEGQYIIKNVLIVALAIVVASNLTPWRSRA